MGFVVEEWRKWLEDAKYDLETAKESLKLGRYNWACFQAQQAAEKALKAVLIKHGKVGILTHSIRDLIRECSKYIEDLIELQGESLFLDAVYVASRYPNGIVSDLPPSKYFSKEDAELCIRLSESILKRVMKYLEK